MGCCPSQPEVEEENPRYARFDAEDRDDYDNCCGCGPWYGGEAYRDARRRHLPNYGSPPGNHFFPEGYAGTRMFPAREPIPPGRGVEIRETGAMMIPPYFQQRPIVGPLQPGYAPPHVPPAAYMNRTYVESGSGMW